MGNTPGLRFQGKCLVNDEGYLYMFQFDEFPEMVKDRLKSSTYNLCPACVAIEAGRNRKRRPEVKHYMNAISQMEAELKHQEENGA